LILWISYNIINLNKPKTFYINLNQLVVVKKPVVLLGKWRLDMSGKVFNRVSISVIIVVVVALLISLSAVLSNRAGKTQPEVDITGVQLKTPKDRVTIHDPSIIKVEDMYYIFGSHIDAAKSTDLINWTRFTNSYTTPNNVIYGNLSENLKESFAWAGQNDSDSKGGFSVWAPDVIWNKDYVNEDGTTGAYMIYYSASSTYIRSAIGFAVSQNIEGPYTYVDTVVYSGFTREEAYDKDSVINKKYTNTNIKSLIDKGILEGPNPSWFSGSGGYNNNTFPNAIDANLFYDKEGKLWMTYGSWSGGLFILEIDKATGRAIYPGKDVTTEDGRIVDRYFGTKISGGFGKSGEGPYVIYDQELDYYYLFATYGWLASDGGYNMRLWRSKNPDGPYTDASGKNAVLPNNTDNIFYGIKLMGNYMFSSLSLGYGYKSPGHNSTLIDSDGQMYLIYHTRFDDRTEGHQVRVHQMFKNEDGWPVVVPYEYHGDTISQEGYSKDEIVGAYEFINHGNSNSSAMLQTQTIMLNEDYSITGDVKGSWSMREGTYYMEITIRGTTYKGVFFKQNDESRYDSKVMTFSAIGSNNQSIWGSRHLDDSTAVKLDAFDLDLRLPAFVNANLKLPSEGANKSTITWSSNNRKVLNNNGVVNRGNKDVEVTLTATITRGTTTVRKPFKMIVNKK
jgi:arabinan endo-1,5-alpha-L-arabinosidase